MPLFVLVLLPFVLVYTYGGVISVPGT